MWRRRAEGLIKLLNGVGAYVAGYQLTGDEWGVGVPWLTATPFDPDGRPGPAPSIGDPLDSVPGVNHGVSGRLPDAPALTEVCMNGGHRSLNLLGGKKGWLITKGTLKRGQAGGRAHHGVEGVFDPRKVQAPGGGVAGGDTT